MLFVPILPEIMGEEVFSWLCSVFRAGALVGVQKGELLGELVSRVFYSTSATGAKIQAASWHLVWRILGLQYLTLASR